MTDQPVKTETALQQEAAARWREIGYARMKEAAALAETLKQSKDILEAPPIGTLYSHPAIVCSCGCLSFTVRQYGCINGVKDKATLSCQRCGTTMTWDWPSMSWVN
jgi:hypothetical protein